MNTLEQLKLKGAHEIRSIKLEQIFFFLAILKPLSHLMGDDRDPDDRDDRDDRNAHDDRGDNNVCDDHDDHDDE